VGWGANNKSPSAFSASYRWLCKTAQINAPVKTITLLQSDALGNFVSVPNAWKITHFGNVLSGNTFENAHCTWLLRLRMQCS
jgi:hypothetical protein